MKWWPTQSFSSETVFSSVSKIEYAFIENEPKEIKKKLLLGKVNVATRGFILVNENEALIKQIENKATEVLIKEFKNKKFNYNELKNNIINEVNTYIIEKTGRKPIILPVLMNIDNYN